MADPRYRPGDDCGLGRDDARAGKTPWFKRASMPMPIFICCLDIDLPWVDDGLRIYGNPDDRQHFFELSKAELLRRGVNWALISGDGEPRFKVGVVGDRGAVRRSN